MFAPGVIGGIALLLALFAMHLLPVNLTGLLLIVLAMVLFVLEAKFPTHGVLGVGGVIAMVLGALMLIRSPLTGMGVSLGAAFRRHAAGGIDHYFSDALGIAFEALEAVHRPGTNGGRMG